MPEVPFTLGKAAYPNYATVTVTEGAFVDGGQDRI